MTRILFAAWLVVVWVALWGDLSAANVLSGTLVAGLLLVVFPPASDRRHKYYFRPIAAARLGWYFVRETIVSNLSLARTILSRGDRLRTGIIAVPLRCESDGLLTIVANLTALTPGLIAIEVERSPSRFYVHVLQLDDIENVRTEILKLERLVVEAFGSPEAVALVRARREDAA